MIIIFDNGNHRRFQALIRSEKTFKKVFFCLTSDEKQISNDETPFDVYVKTGLSSEEVARKLVTVRIK